MNEIQSKVMEAYDNLAPLPKDVDTHRMLVAKMGMRPLVDREAVINEALRLHPGTKEEDVFTALDELEELDELIFVEGVTGDHYVAAAIFPFEAKPVPLTPGEVAKAENFIKRQGMS